MVSSQGSRDPIERLAEQFLEELRQGTRVTIDDFASRHGEQSARIRALFPTLLALESLKNDTVEFAGGFAPTTRIADPSELREIGDFRIQRELGRGGMGVVYEAVQESLERIVALKVMSPSILTCDRQISRFQREARAAARLHHTNIVPVFGSGQQGDIHYYIMQFIDGRGLDEIIARHDSDPADSLAGQWKPAARIIAQVAEALGYSHSQGILHRDVKPGNILLDRNGAVWITDFGLAKAIEQEAMTVPGDAIGTLRYMAPEQLDGNTDERSDVFSLGLTLYELLTGQPAYGDTDHGRLLKSISRCEPPPPSQLAPSIPRDLETVVLKAIAREPADRYRSAAAFAEDLHRFVEDIPVKARRASAIEHAWRWMQRNRAVTVLGGATLVLSLLMTLVSWLALTHTQAALERESLERKDAVAQRQLAVAAQEQAVAEHERALAQSRRADAERARAEENLHVALAAFDQIIELTHQAPAAVAELDEIEDPHYVPPVSNEMAAVLERLLQFYAQFVAENGDDPHLNQQLILAHRRVGDIHRQFARFEEAESSYRRVLAMYDDAGPADATTVDKASVCGDLGAVYLSTGRIDQATDAFSSAQLKLREYLQSHPDSVAAQFELAKAHIQQGELFRLQDDIRRLKAEDRAAIGILTGLVAAEPNNPEFRFHLARAYAHRPPPKPRRGGAPAFAHPENARAIQLLEDLVADWPEVDKYRYHLSETYAHAPIHHPRPGPKRKTSPEHVKQVEKKLKRAVALSRELVRDHPAVPDYVSLHAGNLRKLGAVFQEQGNAEQAETYFRRAIARHAAIANRFGEVREYQYSLASSNHDLARLLNRQFRYQEARELLESSIEQRKKFLQTAAGNRRAQQKLAEQYHDLAESLSGLGETTAAELAAKESHALHREFRPPHDRPIRFPWPPERERLW